MDFTNRGLTVYMMIVAIVMTSKTIETIFHEASAGGIFYVQTLHLWQAYTGIPFDWRAMRVAGPHTPTFLVIVPAFIMSVVMEANPDNIARALYLLACGGLTGAYVLTWHRRNGSQMMINQAAVLVFGVLSTSSSSWHLEDDLRRSMLRIVLASVPPLVSYCQGDLLITPSHGANLMLNVCLVSRATYDQTLKNSRANMGRSSSTPCQYLLDLHRGLSGSSRQPEREARVSAHSFCKRIR
jgi:hypothetical protein